MTGDAGCLRGWRCGMFVFLALTSAPAFAYGQSAALTRDHRQGTALFKAGKFEAAIPFLERSLMLSEREFGPTASRTGFVLKNLATVHEKAGNFDRAARLYHRAVEVLSASLGPDHVVTLETATQRAQADSLARTGASSRKPVTLTPPSSLKPLKLTKPGTVGWTVQLGAFVSFENARKSARDLGAALSDLLQGESLEIREARVSGQRVYRVRTHSIGDRAAAMNLCLQVKARKSQCFVSTVQ